MFTYEVARINWDLAQSKYEDIIIVIHILFATDFGLSTEAFYTEGDKELGVNIWKILSYTDVSEKSYCHQKEDYYQEILHL